MTEDRRTTAAALRRAAPVLAAIAATACLLNVAWIRQNAAPPRSWDDAEYLAESVTGDLVLERDGVPTFLRFATRPARGVHPPMPKLLPIASYVLIGRGTEPALYAFTLSIPIFCVYLFLLAERTTRSVEAGLVAVLVTCAFPLTYGLWRMVMAEFGLAVAVVAAQYHLLRASEGEPWFRRHAVAAGVAIGWAMLWKVSAPVFVAAPVLYVAARLLRSHPDGRRRAAQALLLTVAAATLVAGPFYLLRWRALWAFVAYNSAPHPALEPFALGPPFSPVTILRYWHRLVDTGLSPYFGLLAAGLVLLALRGSGWRLPRASRWFLACCALPPLLFFSLQYLKEPRHLYPAFPVAGILLAGLLERQLHGLPARRRAGIMALMMVVPAGQYVLLSLDTAWTRAWNSRFGPVPLLAAAPDALPAWPADGTRWPVQEVLALLPAPPPDRPQRVRVVGHVPFLDGAGLGYASMLRSGAPLTYNLPLDGSFHPGWWDAAVVLSGPVHNRVERREPDLARLLAAGWLPFRKRGQVALPGGRQATVYAADAGPVAGFGENLVAAQGPGGGLLFPAAGRATPLAQETAARPVDGRLEFPYVYVHPAAQSLAWTRTRASDDCRGSYQVAIVDRHSSRGPRLTHAERFTIDDTGNRSARTSLGDFRGQVVSIRFEASEPAASCLALAEVILE